MDGTMNNSMSPDLQGRISGMRGVRALLLLVLVALLPWGGDAHAY